MLSQLEIEECFLSPPCTNYTLYTNNHMHTHKCLDEALQIP